MNIQECYELLEVKSDISDDDLKAKFKKLAAKYHPDIYPDPEKFKKINSAYQAVMDYRQNPQKYEPKQSGFWSNMPGIDPNFFINLDFQEEWSQNQIKANHIKIHTKLNFSESVLGAVKEISYEHFIKCRECDGAGSRKIKNDCKDCDGFGRVTVKQQGAVFRAACNKCYGNNVKNEACKKCNGKKTISENRTGNVQIPPGVQNGHNLRLAGEGNFAGRSFFGDAYTDVFVMVQVEPDKEMYIKGNDVCCNQKISLLEALEGTKKEIDTVYGKKEIVVQPKSKHCDEIKIPKCGVKNTNGYHIVKLSVDYPEDVTHLIEVLKDAVPNSVQ